MGNILPNEQLGAIFCPIFKSKEDLLVSREEKRETALGIFKRKRSFDSSLAPEEARKRLGEAEKYASRGAFRSAREQLELARGIPAPESAPGYSDWLSKTETEIVDSAAFHAIANRGEYLKEVSSAAVALKEFEEASAIRETACSEYGVREDSLIYVFDLGLVPLAYRIIVRDLDAKLDFTGMPKSPEWRKARVGPAVEFADRAYRAGAIDEVYYRSVRIRAAEISPELSLPVFEPTY